MEFTRFGSASGAHPATGYLPSLSNVGVWDGPEGTVLIDSGNDADAGRKILRALEATGRKLAAVFLTHSNADHSGGAACIASRSGAAVYATRIEAALCADPLLEPSFVWGAFPPPELRNKFFMAPPVSAAAVPEDVPAGASGLPACFAGARIVPLPGHFFSQAGLLADGVLFAGDALFGPESVAKHPVFFVYDVAAFLDSLERIASLGPALVLPSHGGPTEDIGALMVLNRAAVGRVAAAVLGACTGGASAEDVLARLCAEFGIELNWAQYALVGSTVRSYLVYLRGRGDVDAEFSGGRMVWRRS